MSVDCFLSRKDILFLAYMEKHYRFVIKDKEGLLKELDQVAFKESERTYHSNVIFDNGKKDVASAGGRIRLKIVGDSEKKIGIVGEEAEKKIGFHDAEHEIEETLEDVGFHPADGHEFFETKWYLDEISLVLDEFPFADFLEISGDEDGVDTLIGRLGLAAEDHISDTPDDLFNKWREEKGLSFKAYMRFEDYDK